MPVPLCDRPDKWDVYEKLIHDKLISCSAFKEIGNQLNDATRVKGLPDWSVKIYPKKSLAHAASANTNENQIEIECNNEDPTTNAAFELLNLSKRKEINSIYEAMVRGQICDRDFFAKQLEKVEYRNSLKHVELMSQCILEKGWGGGVQKYSANHAELPNWEAWWKVLRISPHAEYYRNKFDSLLSLKNSDKTLKSLSDCGKQSSWEM